MGPTEETPAEEQTKGPAQPKKAVSEEQRLQEEIDIAMAKITE